MDKVKGNVKGVPLDQLANQMRQGQLSVEEIGRGMHRAYRNARDLAEDAQLLLKQRPARAISLAVLALEETAKIFLLAEAVPAAAASPVSWSEIERKLDLRSHREKQGAFSGYGKSILSESYAAAGKRLYKTEMPEGIAHSSTG